MEKCIFLGYPEGYKGWKFYNPTSKRTLISERADFDERYFPMSKRSPLPSQPPPTAPALVPPVAPVEYYNPGATLDSESECNEVLDHGGEPIPLPANPEPPAVPDEAPAPPVHTPSPEPRPRPSSPVGIGARLPMRNRQKPREWWKLSPAQLDEPEEMVLVLSVCALLLCLWTPYLVITSAPSFHGSSHDLWLMLFKPKLAGSAQSAAELLR